MKRIAEIVIIIFFIIFILSLPTSAQLPDQNGECTKPLIAGKQNINSETPAGMVKITSSNNAPDELLVEFITYDGWVMQETHLYVGGEPPKKSAPGRFTYKHDPVENPAYDTYSLSLGDHGLILDDKICFAAHAALQLIGPEGDVLEEETAWALGAPIRDSGGKSKNWAMYFECTGGGSENGGNEETN